MLLRLITITFLGFLLSGNTTPQLDELTTSSIEVIDSSEVVDSSVVVLPFPDMTSSILYLNCEKSTHNNPRFKIHKDTILSLNTLDSRLTIDIKFNWLFDENYYEGDFLNSEYKKLNFYKIIGINSFDIIKNNSTILHQDLTEIISLEAFRDFDSTSFFYDKSYKEIEFIDINFDSYLDIVIPRDSGKNMRYAYFIYDNKSQTFQYDKGLDFLKPYSYDCENKIVYSYDDGTWNSVFLSAYQFHENKFKEIQSKSTFYNHVDSTTVVEYHNANQDLIKREIIERKSID